MAAVMPEISLTDKKLGNYDADQELREKAQEEINSGFFGPAFFRCINLNETPAQELETVA